MPSIPLSQLFFIPTFSGPNRYKDGHLIKANDCYDLDPEKYRIIIRDVRPKHAGNFTLYLSNPKHGLYKNLTIQLVVLGKSLASFTSFWVQVPTKCEAEGPHIKLASGPRINIQRWYCYGWYYKNMTSITISTTIAILTITILALGWIIINIQNCQITAKIASSW